MKQMVYVWLLLLLGTSCNPIEDLNSNPNSVSETHPQYLLTNIQWQAFQVEGVAPLLATRMLVQTDGEDVNQYYAWNRGGFGEYSRLRDVQKMLEEAERLDLPAYQALGKFFRAYYFYNLTLRFGNLPYTEALQGEEQAIYAPRYDTQKEVFKGILSELKEADALLEAEETPIAGDIVFGGSALQWRKIVNAFRLKILLTLSHKTADADLNVVEAFAEVFQNKPLPASNEDNGQLVFMDVSGSRYTEFNSSGYGSARYMDSTFVRRLQDRRDPRLFAYATQTRRGKEQGLAIDDFSAYEGGNPIAPYNDVNVKASEGKVSRVHDRYTKDPVNEPHQFLSYSEVQLILAEAAVRGWIAADAETFYREGVKASFSFYAAHVSDLAHLYGEAEAEAYLAQPLVGLSQATDELAKIERIQMQKYLRSFLQGGWTMYYENLRTNVPAFATLAGSPRPFRWMYPTGEYQNNADHVAAALKSQFGSDDDDIHQKTWWLN